MLGAGGPGAGGGGGGPAGVAGVGAAGRVSISYTPVGSPAYISLDFRPGVTPGLGMLNYGPSAQSPTVIDDCQIGDVICGPLYLVSSQSCEVVVTEIMYCDLEAAK